MLTRWLISRGCPSSTGRVTVATLAELTQPATTPASWPGVSFDPAQYRDGDKVTVLDLPRRVLAALLPHADDLKLLCRVRQAEDASGKPIDEEHAVILGSRLPRAGGIGVAHLGPWRAGTATARSTSAPPDRRTTSV